jgi:hypothetical protein
VKKDISIPCTLERVKELLFLNEETGCFVWRVSRGKRHAGTIAGCYSYGYRLIKIDYKMYTAGRLVWLYITGSWPSDEIDHINGDKLDNRFCNLRNVDRSTNQQNMRVAQKSNKSTGALGVYVDKRNGKIYSSITANGRKYRLGYFDSINEATYAYIKAKRELHQGCTL